ncbi:hypothetical protein DFH08DRAFT_817874 [Mycena albidolilacea]|uniref:Uncharacterized protein n=1 Tax=Mycena albidolilacea TaxID=1033008 RepID=A0AAD6ZIN1_9AGAR|nr:hypothetical protein DFH08DRAFT_817874 [Mycena albidolilacea]
MGLPSRQTGLQANLLGLGFDLHPNPSPSPNKRVGAGASSFFKPKNSSEHDPTKTEILGTGCVRDGAQNGRGKHIRRDLRLLVRLVHLVKSHSKRVRFDAAIDFSVVRLTVDNGSRLPLVKLHVNGVECARIRAANAAYPVLGPDSMCKSARGKAEMCGGVYGHRRDILIEHGGTKWAIYAGGFRLQRTAPRNFTLPRLSEVEASTSGDFGRGNGDGVDAGVLRQLFGIDETYWTWCTWQ